jgi:hypothetical protein
MAGVKNRAYTFEPVRTDQTHPRLLVRLPPVWAEPTFVPHGRKATFGLKAKGVIPRETS